MSQDPKINPESKSIPTLLSMISILAPNFHPLS